MNPDEDMQQLAEHDDARAGIAQAIVTSTSCAVRRRPLARARRCRPETAHCIVLAQLHLKVADENQGIPAYRDFGHTHPEQERAHQGISSSLDAKNHDPNAKDMNRYRVFLF